MNNHVPSQLTDARALFEAWAKLIRLSLERHPSIPDWYALKATNDPWRAWQAALRTARQARPSLGEQLQQKCSDWGAYWRAPDAHGVIISQEQAHELLRDALGVEVEIKPATPASASQAVPVGEVIGIEGFKGMRAIRWTVFPHPQEGTKLYTRPQPASGEGQQGDDSRLLGDLLAVIHGDGGHYTGIYGVGKSVADAIDQVFDLKQKAERAKATQQQAGQAVYQQRDDFGLWRDTDKANHDWWRDHSSTPDEVRTLYTAPQEPDGMVMVSAEVVQYAVAHFDDDAEPEDKWAAAEFRKAIATSKARGGESAA